VDGNPSGTPPRESSKKSDRGVNPLGDSQLPIQTRIVNGYNQAITGAPWQVALIDVRGGTNWGGQFCGGSIISAYWVVTAAHCVDVASRSNYRILAGSATLGSGMSSLTVAEVIVHPSYNEVNARNDIALLRLSAPLSFSKSIQPIALVSNKPGSGSGGLITGWGSMLASDGFYDYPEFSGPGAVNSPDVLQGATVVVQSDGVCSALYGASFNSTEMLCASVPGFWIDTCQGDSGGPLVTGVGSSRVLAGVTSFGSGCAWVAPGVYTNVANYTSWIRDALRPVFSPPVPTATGFTVNVTNYDRAYTYRATIVGGSGRVSVGRASGSTLPLTVTGVAPGASVTVEIATTIAGTSRTDTIAESANAIPTAQFSTPVSTATGFTVNVTNYDRAYTYRATIVGGSGRVSVGRASGSTLPLTVTGVAPGASVTVQIATTSSRTFFRNDTVTGNAQ
jgi:secreted trypsin-like serine protease